MTDAPPPQSPLPSATAPRPPNRPETWSPAARVAVLTEHFVANARRHTPEALAQAALGAGYTQEDVQAAFTAADVRITAAEASAPTRARAQRMILVAYLLTYVVFAIVFLSQPFAIGVGPIALGILTFVMLVALGLSALWARRSKWTDQGAGATVGAILSVPIILLLLVAGTCAFTTFPSIGR
jgi:hypothetical protein